LRFVGLSLPRPKKTPEIAAFAAPSKVGGLLLIVNWPRGEKTQGVEGWTIQKNGRQ
jgi:hypothetical protein